MAKKRIDKDAENAFDKVKRAEDKHKKAEKKYHKTFKLFAPGTFADHRRAGEESRKTKKEFEDKLKRTSKLVQKVNYVGNPRDYDYKDYKKEKEKEAKKKALKKLAR